MSEGAGGPALAYWAAASPAGVPDGGGGGPSPGGGGGAGADGGGGA